MPYEMRSAQHGVSNPIWSQRFSCKIGVFLPALLLSSLAQAGKIDCSTLRSDPLWNFRYQEVESFPNPLKVVKLDLYDLGKPFRFADCGVVVEANSQQYSVKAKDTKTLLTVMGGILSWNFKLLGVQKTGTKLNYFKAADIRINLPDGLMHKEVEIVGTFNGPYLPQGALMAVRADGGKLMPLMYNGVFREVTIDPKVKTLEIFAKSSTGILWERMLLDVTNSKMTFFKKASFPTK